MNYYNEFDPFAAQWLRNLIAAGLIPAGEVDERSITEVQPSDLQGFAQCHFFAGIAGWPLALEMAAWPVNAPVWTGSCPCQPFSAAGKRKGTADERHLWPEFRRLIAQCRPPVVFGEQVASKDGLTWLAGVRADLEGAGYAVGAADLCAAGVATPEVEVQEMWQAEGEDEPHFESHRRTVGPPHIRQRIWWVADTECAIHRRQAERSLPEAQCTRPASGVGRCGSDDRRLADANGGIEGNGELQRSGQHGFESQDRGTVERLANASSPERGRRGESEREHGRTLHVANGSGACGMANSGQEQRGWWPDEQPTGIAVATERDKKATDDQRGGTIGNHWRNFQLIPCRDGKTRRIGTGVQPLAHGIPSRVGKLRGAGNAICPQVAAEFIKAYLEAVTPTP